MNGRAVLGALATLVVALSGVRVEAQDDPERDRARLRDEIVRLERELERQIGRRDDRLAELRAVELALAETEAERRSIVGAIAAERARGEAIAADQAASAERLREEEAALADQVRMSYMTGRQEFLRLLLSEQNPAELGRMLVYYDYLNRHRTERIAAVDAELTRLAGLAAESDAVAARLAALETELAGKVAALDSDRAERRSLLAALEAGIDASGDRIGRMRAEAEELDRLIERLATIAEGFPLNGDAPFAAQRGRLAWPVAGQVARKFGEARDTAGRLRWDGVLIEAEAGTVVRAVYSGRVLLAEWTPHMGLLLILDHGDGYMSLYGHNAALLREQGDLVAPGDPIAEVGDTGGQLGAGLYFGLRQDALPIDPGSWMR